MPCVIIIVRGSRDPNLKLFCEIVNVRDSITIDQEFVFWHKKRASKGRTVRIAHTLDAYYRGKERTRM